jgi:hypothetical protein
MEYPDRSPPWSMCQRYKSKPRRRRSMKASMAGYNKRRTCTLTISSGWARTLDSMASMLAMYP